MTQKTIEQQLVLVLTDTHQQNAEMFEQIKRKYRGNSPLTMKYIFGGVREVTANDARYVFVSPRVNKIRAFSPHRIVIHPEITLSDHLLAEIKVRVLTRQGTYGTEI